MTEPTTKDFLLAIWGEQIGVAELTVIDKAGPRSFPFTYPDSLETLLFAIPRHNGKSNVYVGVCLRKTQWPAGERGKSKDALSSLAAWVDIDYKVTPREKALALVKPFKLSPSVIVKSGGGIHCYWLLREPATGDDLLRVPLINKALATALEGDRQSTDLARILRVPGTLNLKYTPPVPCELSFPAWHPERRYVLDDFDFLAPGVPTPISNKNTSGKSSEAARPEPSYNIDPLLRDKIEGLLADIWEFGVRHHLALYVSGTLAYAGIGEECAKLIIRNVSARIGGDAEKRIKDVADTYAKYRAGSPVAGGPSLEELFDKFPKLIQPKARQVWETVRRSIPRPRQPKPAAEPEFKILYIEKYTSSPARWVYHIEKADGIEIVISGQTETTYGYPEFQEQCWEQQNVILSPLKQQQWGEMLAAAEIRIIQAPKEANPDGEFEETLNEFLALKRESPDTGTLQKFPGYSDGETFFKLKALKAFAKEGGHRQSNHETCDRLRKQGFIPTSKWIGDHAERLWLKKVEGNGHKLQGELFTQVPE